MVDNAVTAVKETRIAGYLDEVVTTVADVGWVLDIVPSRMAAAPAPRSARVAEVQPELSTLDSVKVDVSVDVGAARLDAPTLRAPDSAMRERVEANIATSRAVREARIENRNAANSKRERVLQNVVEQRKIRSARADSGWGGYKAREADVVRNSSANIQKKLPRVRFTTKTIEAMGPAPKGMKNPHRHHILEVNGRPGEHRAIVREGQEILRSYDIDPLQGVENLVWAPNKGHTLNAASDLVSELRNARDEGLDRNSIVEILMDHGQRARGR